MDEELQKIINEAIQSTIDYYEEQNDPYNLNEIRTDVYENIRDHLKMLMSDVAYN